METLLKYRVRLVERLEGWNRIATIAEYAVLIENESNLERAALSAFDCGGMPRAETPNHEYAWNYGRLGVVASRIDDTDY